jgi:hypothetical protein
MPSQRTKLKTLPLFDILNQGPLYLFLISPKKKYLIRKTTKPLCI